MRLPRILNQCHPIPGFVYLQASFAENEQSILILVRPRKRSAAICSGCHQPAPGYDQSPTPRRFEFIGFWGYLVFLVYCMRRVNCKQCGVLVEEVPWGMGKHTSTRVHMHFLGHWARKLSWNGRKLPDRSRAPHRALVYETVFALLYGLGLRVGEVARLRLGDVDFSRDILMIRDTKFSKSRLVPLGPTLAQRLRDYVEQRHTVRKPELPLFSFTKRGCICEGTISQTFHALVPKLELRLAPGVSSPRVHDLRHSFAVGTLLRWYRQGIDPNRRLIHLSTFLGHVDPNSTAVYLTITDELLREADRRFRAFAPIGAAQ